MVGTRALSWEEAQRSGGGNATRNTIGLQKSKVEQVTGMVALPAQNLALIQASLVGFIWCEMMSKIYYKLESRIFREIGSVAIAETASMKFWIFVAQWMAI
jgi:hypothetical protein